jgi:hypothetical protein
VIEIVKGDVDEHLNALNDVKKYEGLAKSGFTVEKGGYDKAGQFRVEDKTKVRVPYDKGRILEKSDDTFGEAFTSRLGSDRKEYPGVGDIVWFIENSTSALDPKGLYHMLSDEDIKGWMKKEEFEAKEIQPKEEVTNVR